MSKETFDEVHGIYDYKKAGFNDKQNNKAYQEFKDNAIIEINKRKQKTDFLLCAHGMNHKPIADKIPGIIVIELVAYENSFATHRIFTSYSWMNYI